MKKINILVTGAGSGVGQSIIKSLKISNINCNIISADINECNAALYRTKKSILVPKVEKKGTLNWYLKNLKKLKINISGPLSADTSFLKKNRDKFDIIIGMYHDQVLTPIKTLFEYNAINLTMGLPFFRVSPDHGPNEKMFGKNKSDPKSLIMALKFLDNK